MDKATMKLQILSLICASNNEYTPGELLEATKSMFDFVTENMTFESDAVITTLREVH